MLFIWLSYKCGIADCFFYESILNTEKEFFQEKSLVDARRRRGQNFAKQNSCNQMWSYSRFV